MTWLKWLAALAASLWKVWTSRISSNIVLCNCEPESDAGSQMKSHEVARNMALNKFTNLRYAYLQLCLVVQCRWLKVKGIWCKQLMCLDAWPGIKTHQLYHRSNPPASQQYTGIKTIQYTIKSTHVLLTKTQDNHRSPKLRTTDFFSLFSFFLVFAGPAKNYLRVSGGSLSRVTRRDLPLMVNHTPLSSPCIALF